MSLALLVDASGRSRTWAEKDILPSLYVASTHLVAAEQRPKKGRKAGGPSPRALGN